MAIPNMKILVILMICSSSALAHSDIKCLALNIYHEVRGEPIIGQVAVAKVVLNRVASSNYYM